MFMRMGVENPNSAKRCGRLEVAAAVVAVAVVSIYNIVLLSSSPPRAHGHQCTVHIIHLPRLYVPRARGGQRGSIGSKSARALDGTHLFYWPAVPVQWRNVSLPDSGLFAGSIKALLLSRPSIHPSIPIFVGIVRYFINYNM